MTQRDAYQQKLEAKLDKWRAEIESLRAQAAEVGADAKIEYHKDLEALSLKQKNAEQKLAALKQAGNETWDAARTSAENVADSLEQEFNRFRAKMEKAGEKVSG